MDLDLNKIDDATLALLYLGLHDGARTWKGFDWEVMNRLHEAGYITDPRVKAKSVLFTVDGLERAARLLEQLFGKAVASGATAPTALPLHSPSSTKSVIGSAAKGPADAVVSVSAVADELDGLMQGMRAFSTR